ncbi:MAG TPA: sulfatase-like hydrolase/transferase, partial [Candidatus Acidoferrales bacterium]|nr:sulfatase-like hydrolase/transferase [Candidatus Acidoferrales bacterium]
MRRARSELGHAATVATIGGLILGLREGLLSAQANAFAKPGQYLLLYLTVPIWAWVVLALLILIPLALLRAITTRSASNAFAAYVAALAFCGSLAATAGPAADLLRQLREVDAAIGWPTFAAVVVINALLAVVAAFVSGAAARWYQARIGSAPPLRRALPAAVVTSLLCLVPSLRFLATDWKRGTAPTTDPHPNHSPDGDRPNVLLISVDTLRADHLGAYGDPSRRTPNIDVLASSSLVFEQAITSAPWTLPAMASLMTGLYPHHHHAGEITNGHDPLGRSALSPAIPTLASLLSANGYRTHAIVTNPYLLLAYGFGTGFETYE